MARFSRDRRARPVEAMRCAIDVQETIEARNLAYPSRHMNVRIGITIGDVVERENGANRGSDHATATRFGCVPTATDS